MSDIGNKIVCIAEVSGSTGTFWLNLDIDLQHFGWVFTEWPYTNNYIENADNSIEKYDIVIHRACKMSFILYRLPLKRGDSGRMRIALKIPGSGLTLDHTGIDFISLEHSPAEHIFVDFLKERWLPNS